MSKCDEIALLTRAVWADNAVEYLVGALSSLCSESQLEALVAKLREESSKSSVQMAFRSGALIAKPKEN